MPGSTQIAWLHDELGERTRRGAARGVVAGNFAAQKQRQLEHALVPCALVIQVDAGVKLQAAGSEQSRCPFRVGSRVPGLFHRGRYEKSDAGAGAVEVVFVEVGGQLMAPAGWLAQLELGTETQLVVLRSPHLAGAEERTARGFRVIVALPARHSRAKPQPGAFAQLQT